jgi:hypothetical protein
MLLLLSGPGPPRFKADLVRGRPSTTATPPFHNRNTALAQKSTNEGLVSVTGQQLDSKIAAIVSSTRSFFP